MISSSVRWDQNVDLLLTVQVTNAVPIQMLTKLSRKRDIRVSTYDARISFDYHAERSLDKISRLDSNRNRQK